jgi:hypothetical protein
MTPGTNSKPETLGAGALSWVVPPIAVPVLLGAMILAAALYRAAV